MAPFQGSFEEVATPRDNFREVMRHLCNTGIIETSDNLNKEISRVRNNQFSAWEGNALSIFGNDVSVSMPYLGDIDTVAIIFVTFVALLTQSSIFRILIHGAMKTGILHKIRFENRYQLANVPINDLPGFFII